MLQKIVLNPLAILALSVSMVTACTGSNTKTQETFSLKGTAWQLKTLQSQAIKVINPLTLEFEGNRIGGFSGCNRYFGSYKSNNDGTFSSGSLASTRIACLEPENKLETQFLRTLEKAKQYAVVRDQLHLLDAERKIIAVFNTAPKKK